MTISLAAALAILAHLVAFGRVADDVLALDANTSSISLPLIACRDGVSPHRLERRLAGGVRIASITPPTESAKTRAYR